MDLSRSVEPVKRARPWSPPSFITTLVSLVGIPSWYVRSKASHRSEVPILVEMWVQRPAVATPIQPVVVPAAKFMPAIKCCSKSMQTAACASRIFTVRSRVRYRLVWCRKTHLPRWFMKSWPVRCTTADGALFPYGGQLGEDNKTELKPAFSRNLWVLPASREGSCFPCSSHLIHLCCSRSTWNVP